MTKNSTGMTRTALKELADLVYVCFQYAANMEWDLDEALSRVHRSNLSKLVDGKPLRREDGKVLKGPHYKPPTLNDLVQLIMKLYENRDALARQLEEAIQNVYMIQGAQQAVNQLIKEYEEENTTTETTTED